MKFSKKLCLVLGLVVILASLLASTALAAGTRVVRFANVTKIKVVDDQPATFRLLGNYACDKLQVSSSVSGKTITLYVNDVKLKGAQGSNCETTQPFSKTITVGVLVPGTYTVLVNPGENGKPQKKLTGFIAPLIPATATPAPAPAP